MSSTDLRNNGGLTVTHEMQAILDQLGYLNFAYLYRDRERCSLLIFTDWSAHRITVAKVQLLASVCVRSALLFRGAENCYRSQPYHFFVHMVAL
jgi:hypothetical protein